MRRLVDVAVALVRRATENLDSGMSALLSRGLGEVQEGGSEGGRRWGRERGWRWGGGGEES